MDTLEFAPLPPVPPQRPIRPTSTGGFSAFLVHHNPFYLLSALCMIAGCYALNSALDTRSGELPKILLLLATLNVYEVALIALGLFLIVRHGIDRDGRTLLLLETVFLVDLTFLNAETASTRLSTGIAVNAIVFVLSLIKVAVVLRALVGRIPMQSYLFIALQLMALAAMPCAMKWVGQHNNGNVSLGAFYTMWWIVGFVLITRELQLQLEPIKTTSGSNGAQVEIGVATDVRRIYQVAPYLSLVAHLCMLHWVYKTEFFTANVSPVLLGMAILLARRTPSWITREAAAFLRVVLPMLAVGMALISTDELSFSSRYAGRIPITPVLVTCAVAYFVYVYAYAIRHALYFISAAVLAGLAAMFGPSIQQIETAGERSWAWMATSVRRLVPHTAGQWGITAVCGAFAFLGIGAAISLRKRKPAE